MCCSGRHSLFKQEVIYIQGANFKRGGAAGAGAGAGGDLFVSIRDKHTLSVKVRSHTDVYICDNYLKRLLNFQISLNVTLQLDYCCFSVALYDLVGRMS